MTWDEGERREFVLRLHRLSLTAAVGWGIFGVRNLLHHYPLSTLTCFAISAMTLLLSRTQEDDPRRANLWVHCSVALNALGLTSMGLLTGQADSTTPLTFLTIIPLFAAYQLGIRSALGWTLVAALLIIAVHASTAFYPITPEFNPAGWQLALDRLVMLGVIATFAVQARYVNEQRLEHIQKQSLSLKQARDDALQAAELKSAFLANMSHEIRTPLHGVLGLSELLSQSQLSEEDRRNVEAIQASGQLLLTVVNDILDFSRLEKGLLALESIHFSLDEVLQNVVELNLSAARKKGLSLWLDIQPELPGQVLGDPTRLQQILFNLLSNAIKFTSQGHVQIRAERQEQKLRLTVKDTGSGIPTDQIGRLFQPFEQLDSSITRQFGGSGLGLAICQSLAQQMGSEIQVESRPGEGSLFWFELPLQADLPPPPQPLDGLKVCLRGLPAGADSGTRNLFRRMGASLVEEEDPWEWWVNGDSSLTPPTRPGITIWVGEEPILPPGYQRLVSLPLTPNLLLRQPRGPSSSASVVPSATKVLVVEDNSVNQKVIQGMLKRLGLEAQVAVHGMEALQALAAEPYELLLMDLQMPVMDGLEATRRIRLASHGPQPYIIIVTANAFPDVQERVVAAGANDFLTKPLHLKELALALARFQTVRNDTKSQ